MANVQERAKMAINALNGVAASSKTWSPKDGNERKRWTREIGDALKDRGAKSGYEHCGHGAQRGEWLYDLCWLERQPGTKLIRAMPLAAEVEWDDKAGSVHFDFEKLLFSRAELCLMVWCTWPNRNLCRERQQMKKAINVAGDSWGRYLLACLHGQEFHYECGAIPDLATCGCK
ncbi:MAG: hypothetical protein ACRD1M_00905 [Terriglobales bacterium]